MTGSKYHKMTYFHPSYKSIIVCSLLVFSLFLPSTVSAQSQKKIIKIGDQLYAGGDFYGASIWYRKAMNIDSTEKELVYKYAESLRLYNEYEKAAHYYYYVYKKDRGRVFPLAAFWYSTMLKYNGDYKNAKKFFKRSKRSFMRDKKGYYYQKVMQEIKSCDFAAIAIKDSVSVDIKNMGNSINTYSSELGANFLNDSVIIYSSLRDEEMSENNEISDTTSYLFRLFKGSKNGNLWGNDGQLEEKINEPGFHIANGCLNPKGIVFYYTKCDKALKCNIYAIQYEKGEWKTPYEIKNVNADNYTSTQPYVENIDGKEVLFFSSNRPKGEGKMDIWYSRKNNFGRFDPPTNAGSKINTIDNEITPFYNTKDTSLYFSSDWHNGLGGFDIFKSKTNLVTYKEPENLGFPINTSVNDFYYSIKNNTALLTSNRKGSYTKKGETCCNDIYIYEIPDTVKPVYSELEELNRYLPTLYFHNDEPNPRTTDTLTEKNYITTYNDYYRLIATYKKEYSKGLEGHDKEDAVLDIEDFFEEYVKKGVDDLNLFIPLLMAELESGSKITLTIKGYASPLSKSDYNVNLTLRRISSLINYLSEYEHGKIKPYIDGSASNGGELHFIKIPFGEYKAVKNVSDNINDTRNSVYSRSAALERKIEVISVSEGKPTTE